SGTASAPVLTMRNFIWICSTFRLVASHWYWALRGPVGSVAERSTRASDRRGRGFGTPGSPVGLMGPSGLSFCGGGASLLVVFGGVWSSTWCGASATAGASSDVSAEEGLWKRNQARPVTTASTTAPHRTKPTKAARCLRPTGAGTVSASADGVSKKGVPQA